MLSLRRTLVLLKLMNILDNNKYIAHVQKLF